MYEDEFERVKKSIERLHIDGKLSNRKIIMFGVSEETRQMIKILNALEYNTSYVIDNDFAKVGSNCYQVPVKHIDELSYEEIAYGVFFIYCYFWREMKAQLLDKGVDEKRIHSFFISERSLDEQFERAEKGEKICDKFREEIGDYRIFLCPYAGTGDIYLIGTFWNEYVRRNKIQNYIFVVVSKACAKVTELFDIQNVRQISKIEGSYVVEYYKLCGEEAGIKILNDSWWELRANPLQRFRGFKGLYFMQIFRKFVFDFDDEVVPVHPILKNVDEQLMPLFQEKKIKPNRTVILSPYSNTLSDICMDFWEEIVIELHNMGYDTCTNCGPDESPIKGTCGVFVPLSIAPQFVSMAGFFIGVRSGFCDCISGSTAKKIILYDRKNIFHCCRAYEYFNLKNMGLCNDALELEYDIDELQDIKDVIMNEFSPVTIDYMTTNKFKNLRDRLTEYSKEYNAIVLIVDDVLDVSSFLEVLLKKHIKEKYKVLSTAGIADKVAIAENIDVEVLVPEEIMYLKKIYDLYDFSDNFLVISNEPGYGTLWNLVNNKLLTVEEAIEALLR